MGCEGSKLIERPVSFFFFILLLATLAISTTPGSGEEFSDSIERKYDSNSVFMWEPSNSVKISSLALSGQISGTGNSSVFLIYEDEKHLISKARVNDTSKNISKSCFGTCNLSSFSNEKYIIRLKTKGNINLSLDSLHYSSYVRGENKKHSSEKLKRVDKTSEGEKRIDESSSYSKTEMVDEPTIETGEKVEWFKTVKIKSKNRGRVDITESLPSEASKISVRGEEGEIKPQKKYSVQSNSNQLEFQQELSENEKKYYTVSYETPAPKKIESDPKEKRKKWKKNITISSELSYKDVVSSTRVKEAEKENIKLYWDYNYTREKELNSTVYNEILKNLSSQKEVLDVSDYEIFDVKYLDTNNNNLTDMLKWRTPHLSDQEFRVLVELTSLNANTEINKNNWTIYFETSDDSANLTFNVMNNSDKLELKNLYYQDKNKDWYVHPSTKKGNNLTADWEGDQYTESEYAKGKVVYDISELDEFRVNMTFGEVSETVENHIMYDPITETLDLENPIFNLSLCHFNDTFWECDPDFNSPSDYEKGYFGENIKLDNDKVTKYFNLPSQIDVFKSSIQLTPITNQSINEIGYGGTFSGSSLSSGNISSDYLKEIIYSSGEILKVISPSGNEVWNESLSSIEDVSSGDITTDSGDEVAVVSQEGLSVYSASGSLLDRSSGPYNILEVEDIDRRFKQYYKDDSFGEGRGMIGKGNKQRFYLPGINNTENAKCYLKSAFNYKGDKDSDLMFSINDSVYDVDEDQIKEDSVFNYNNTDGESYGYKCIGCEENGVKFSLDYPISSPVQAKKCYLKTALYNMGGRVGNLSLKIDGNEYDVEESSIQKDLNPTVYERGDDTAESVKRLNGKQRYEADYDIRYPDVCKVTTALNYHGSKGNDISLNVDGSDYDINEELISTQDNFSFGNFTSFESIGCVGCSEGETKQKLNLWNNTPTPFPAQDCFVKAPFNYRVSKYGNLTFELNKNKYDIDESQIQINNTLNYKINGSDDTAEESKCVGCGNDQLRFYLGFGVPESIPAKECYVKTAACYEGDKSGNLRFDITGNPRYNYSVNETKIKKSCSEGFDWIHEKVKCEDIIPNETIRMWCDDCDNESNYHIMGDNSTESGNSYYWDGTNWSYPDYDYMIQIYSNTSLKHNWTNTEVDCSDIQKDNNITFSCNEGCKYSSYNLIQDSVQESNSYGYNSGWNHLKDYENIVEFYTNTSLRYDKVFTPVDCIDLHDGANLTYSCQDCNSSSYFNILQDNSTSGSSYTYNDTWESIKSDHIIDIHTAYENFSWVHTPVNCNDISKGNNVTFECEGCNSSDNFGLSTESGEGTSYIWKEGWKNNPSDFMVGLYSNTSLYYSLTSTKINCSDTGNNVTFICPNCTDSNYYMIQDNSTEGNSYSYNGSWRNLSSLDNIVRLKYNDPNEKSRILVGDELNKISLYSNNSDLRWNTSLDTSIHSLDMGQLDFEISGSEILVGGYGKAIVLNSSGGIVNSFSMGPNRVTSTYIGEVNYQQKALIGLSNGSLYSCSIQECSPIDTTNTNSIEDISQGDLKPQAGEEIIVSFSDGKIVLFDNRLNKITSYQIDSEISGLQIGDFNEFVGKEIAILTSENIKIMNLRNPKDISIELDDYQENISTLEDKRTIEFDSSEVNDYLSSCTGESCDVPLVLSSDSSARFNIKQPLVSFSYNATSEVDYRNTNTWSETEGFRVGDELYYNALNISYEKPSLSLYVRYINVPGYYINDETIFNGESCYSSDSNVYLGYTGEEGGSYGGCDRDYYISPSFKRDSDLLWYDKSYSRKPVKSKNVSYWVGDFYAYDVTIYRDTNLTNETFEKVEHTFNINDSKIDTNPKFKVDWYENGTYYDITPSELGNCNVPEYENIYVGEDGFKVCWDDTDGNDLPDLLRWEQPLVGSEGENHSNVSYKIEDTRTGSLNIKFLDDKKEIFRKDHGVLSAQIYDSDSNELQEQGHNCTWYINNTLEDTTQTGEDGICEYEWNISCESGLDLDSYSVNVTLPDTKKYSGDEDSGSVSIKDNLNLNITHPSNETLDVDNGEKIQLEAEAWDSCGSIPADDEDRVRWKDNLGHIYTGLNVTYEVNEEGGSIPITLYEIHDYYETLQNDSIELLLENLIEVRLLNNEKFYRTSDVTNGRETYELKAQIHTGEGVPINESSYTDPSNWSDYSCYWYEDGEYVEGTSTNEGKGTCDFLWNSNCSKDLKNYDFKVRIENQSQKNYNFTSGGNVSEEEITLVDKDYSVSLENPKNVSVYYFKDNANIDLNVTDSCGNNAQNVSRNVIYQDIDTYQALGDVDDWFVGSYAYGEANLTAKVSDEFYVSKRDTVSLSVWRETSLKDEIDVPYYPPKDTLVNTSCSVNIDGLSNLSGYNVTHQTEYFHERPQGDYAILDGNDDYVNVSHSSSLNITGDKMTMGGWIYRDESFSDRRMILNKENKYEMSVNSDEELSWAIQREGIWNWIDTDIEIPLGKWTYVSVVYDGSEVRSYKNGELGNTTSLSGNIDSSDAPLFIGWRSSKGGNLWKGKMDEITIYNTSLSSSQIKDSYDRGMRGLRPSKRESLVGYWDFERNDTNYGTWMDKSGLDHETHSYGPYREDGKVEDGAKFDGENDYVEVIDDGSLCSNQNLTIEGWIYSNGEQSSNGGSMVWNGDDDGFAVEPRSNHTRVNYGGEYSALTGNITHEEWQHWSFVYNESTGKLYRDGQLVDSRSDLNLDCTSDNVWIGKRGGHLQHSFNGTIDQVRIYNRTLTPKEINTTYQRNKNGKESNITDGLVGYWDFENRENIFDEWADKSGEENNGSPKNGIGTSEHIGDYVKLDGQDDRIEVNDSGSLDSTEQVTVSAWVKNKVYGGEQNPATSCLDIKNSGESTGDGIYWIEPEGSDSGPYRVYCDMTTEGGGWTLVASRADDGNDYWTWNNQDNLYNGNSYGIVDNYNTSDYQSHAWDELKGSEVMFMKSDDPQKYLVYGDIISDQTLSSMYTSTNETVGEFGPPINISGNWWQQCNDSGNLMMSLQHPDSDSNGWDEGGKGFIWRSINENNPGSCSYDDTSGGLTSANQGNSELWESFYPQNFNNIAQLVFVKKSTYDYPQSCEEIAKEDSSAESGDYFIDPDGEGGNKPYQTYCDLRTYYDDVSAENNFARAFGPSSTTGQVNESLEFDGTYDYLATNFSYEKNRNISQMTVCAWAKSSSNSSQVIMATDRSDYWRFSLKAGGGIGFHTTSSGLGAGDFVVDGNYTDGEWHYVCGWFNQSESTPDKKIFVDGEFVDSTNNHSGEPLGRNVEQYGLIGVGSEAYDFDGQKGPAHYMEGKIDDLIIYNASLSSSEINESYQRGLDGSSPVDKDSLVAHWSFDDKERTREGWTRVVKWDRENEGDNLSDFENIMTEEILTMEQWENKEDFIRWSQAGASDKDEMKFSRDIPVNGDEVELDLHFEGISYENSGVTFYVMDSKGEAYPIKCENDNDLQEFNDGIECSYSNGETFTWNGTFNAKTSSNVEKYYIASEHDDCCFDSGDSSDLYRFELLVRNSTYETSSTSTSTTSTSTSEVTTSSTDSDYYNKSVGVEKGNAYGFRLDKNEIVGKINNDTLSNQILDGWNHVVLTYNKSASSGNQKLYLNGELKKERNLGESINVNNDKLIIGDKLSGNIDNIIIYNTTLSSAQVNETYQRGTKGLPSNITDSRVGYWDFEENDITSMGKKWADKSENDNDAEPIGDTSIIKDNMFWKERGSLFTEINRETDSEGVSTLTWDTTGFSEGPHEIKCNIDDDEDKYFTTTSQDEVKEKVVIPTDLLISSNFVDSREWRLHDCGDHYVPKTTVYRGQSDFWQEPNKLFLGANISTVYGPEGKLYPMDNISVHFNIMDGNNTIDKVDCTTDISEFRSRGNLPDDGYNSENLCDHYYNRFVCYEYWEPNASVEVGDYSVFVNVIPPSEEWSYQTLERDITVKGVLYNEIVTPNEGEKFWSDENMTIELNVTDDTGKELTKDDNHRVSYSYDGGGIDGCTGWEFFDIQQNTKEFNIWNQMNNTHDLGNIASQQNKDRDWHFDVKAYSGYHSGDSVKTHYPRLTTQYNPEIAGCEYLHNPQWDYSFDPEIFHKSKVRMTEPTDDITDYNHSTGMANFTCRVSRLVDGASAPENYPIWFKCKDCEAPVNTGWKKAYTDVNGEKSFQINMSQETVGMHYNLTCLYNYTLGYSDNSLRYRVSDVQKYGNHTRNIKIVSQLGEGGGECDYDGKCEPNDGETCMSCPDDCDGEVWIYEKTDGDQGNPSDTDGHGCYCIKYNSGNDDYTYGYPSSSDGPNASITDGTCNYVYEHTTRCDDCTQTNNPPKIKHLRSDKNYEEPNDDKDKIVRPGTQLYIKSLIEDDHDNSSDLDVWLTEGGNSYDMSYTTEFSDLSEEYFFNYYYDLGSVNDNHTFTLHAMDKGGEESTSDINIYVDDSTPVIKGVQFLNGKEYEGKTYYSEGDDVKVQVTLGEDDTLIKYVKADGNTLSYSGNNEWTGTLTAQETDHTINIDVEDEAEHSTSDSITYYVDSDSPFVNITKPESGDYYTQPKEVDTEAEIYDPSGLGDNSTYQARLNENTWYNMTNIGNNMWGHTFNLDGEGWNIFEVKASDYAGNVNRSYSGVFLDTSDPSISNTGLQQSDNVVNSDENIALSSDSTDKRLDSTKVYKSSSNKYDLTRDWQEIYNNNGVVIDIDTDRVSSWNKYDGDVTLERGDFIVTRGTTSGSDIDFTGGFASTTPPHARVSGENGVYEVYRGGDVQGTYAEAKFVDVSDISDTSTGEYTGTPSDLGCTTEGVCQLTIYANDTSGNEQTKNFDLEIDDTSPTIENFTLSGGNYYANSGDDVTFKVDVSEDNPDSVELEGIKMSPTSGNTYELTKKPEFLGCTSEGSCDLTISAKDKAGNSNSITETIHIDDTNPSILYTSNTLPNGTIKSGDDWIFVEVDTSDSNMKNVTFNLLNERTASKQATGTLSENFTNLNPNSGYDFNVQAIDKADNTNTTETRTIILDSAPPFITLSVSDNDGVVRSDQKIEFISEAQDEHDVINLTLNKYPMNSISSNEWRLYNTTEELSCSKTSGICQINSTATDIAGNKNQTSVNLTVDNQEPNLYNFSINETDLMKQTNSLNISIEMDEKHPDTIRVGNENKFEMKNSEGNVRYKATTPEEMGCDVLGDCKITATATDLAENTNSKSDTILVDSVKPEVNILKPSKRSSFLNDDYIYVESEVNETHRDKITFSLYRYENQTTEKVTINNTQLIENHTFENLDPNARYMVSVKSTDQVGNTGLSDEYNVTLDSKPPEMIGYSINDSDMFVKAYSPIRINVSFNDENPAPPKLNEVEMEHVSGNDWTKVTTAYDLEPIEEGIINVNINLRDKAGNVNDNHSFELSVDGRPPQIDSFTIDDPTNDKVVKPDESYRYILQFEETNVRNVTLNNTEMNKSDSSNPPDYYVYELNETPSHLGCKNNSNCTLTARVVDRVYYTNSTNMTLFIDNITPSVEKVEIGDEDNITRGGEEIDFNMTINENHGLDHVRLGDSSDNTLMNIVNKTFAEVTVKPDEIGCSDVVNDQCKIKTELSDKASNINDSFHFNLTIDEVSPNVTDLRSDDKDDIVTSSQKVDFMVDVSDKHLTGVYLNGTQMSKSQNNTYKYTSNVSEFGCGSSKTQHIDCNLVSTAWDAVGNMNSTNYTIEVDDAPPIIQNLNVTNTAEGTKATNYTPYVFPGWNTTFQVESTAPDGDLIDSIYLIPPNCSGCDNSTVDFTSVGGNKYNATIKPGEIGLTNGTYVFRAKSSDVRNNYQTTNESLLIASNIPLVNNITSSKSLVEINKNTTISFQISSAPDLTDIVVNITSRDYESSAIPYKEEGNYTRRDFSVNMTPRKSGWYNVSVYVKNEYGGYNTIEEENVFLAVGKTNATLTRELISTEGTNSSFIFENISYNNKGSINFTFNLTNEGNVSFYNSSIFPLKPVKGISYIPPEHECGTIESGESCIRDMRLEVDANANTKEHNIDIIGQFTNPNNYTDFAYSRGIIEILANPKMDVLNETISMDNISYSQEYSLGNATIFASGNEGLENVSINKLSGDLDTSWIEFTPSTTDIEKLSTEDISINVTIPKTGKVNGTFNISASNPGCQNDDCWSKLNINTIVQDTLNIFLENISSKIVYRDRGEENLTYNITLNVKALARENSSGDYLPQDNVTIHFYGSYLGNCTTDSSGICTFTWNPDNSFLGGEHNLSILGEGTGFTENSSLLTLNDSITIYAHSSPNWLNEEGEVEVNISETLKCAVNDTQNGTMLENYSVQMWSVEPVEFNSTVFSASSGWVSSDNESYGNLMIEDSVVNITTNSTYGIKLNKSLKLEGFDHLEVNITNMTDSNWSLRYVNSTNMTQYIAQNTNNTYLNKTVTNKTIKNMTFIVNATQISNNESGNVLLDSITLSENVEYSNHTEIGESRFIEEGNENLTGSMENITYTKNSSERGWYIKESNLSFKNFSFTNVSFTNDSIQGEYSLEMSVNNLTINNSAKIVKNNTEDLSNYTKISFWTKDSQINDDINITFNISNDEQSRIISITPSLNWTYYQTSIKGMDNITQFSWNLENTNDTEQYEPTFYLDSVKVMKRLETNASGIADAEWFPRKKGKYRLLCNISDEQYYNASPSEDVIVQEITSLGGGTEEGEEEGGEDTEDEDQSQSGGGGGGGGGSSGDEIESYCGDGKCAADETRESCPQDCDPTLRVQSVCGDGNCSLGESIFNCPEDCAKKKPFKVDHDIHDPEIYAGENQTFSLNILNKLQRDISPKIKMNNEELEEFISYPEQVTISSLKEKRIPVLISVPVGKDPAVYSGDMIVEWGDHKTSSPITLTTSESKEEGFKARLNLMKKQYDPEGELKAHLSFYSPTVEKKSVDIQYIIRDALTDEVVRRINETVEMGSVKTKSIEIPLNFSWPMERMSPEGEKYATEVSTSPVNYLIEVKANTSLESSSDVEIFTVYSSFWTKQKILTLVFSLISLSLFFLMVYGGYKYRQIKKSKSRYVFPTNYNLLPQKSDKSLWVGKIAGTKKDAWINRKDLLTHVLTAGATGSGKSVSASVIVEEVLKKKIPVVVFDPTAQWTGFVKSCEDPKLLKFYKQFKMKKLDAHSFKGLIYDVDTPNIKPEFKKYMNPGEVTVFNLRKLKPGQYDTAVRNIVQTIFNQQWEEATDLKMLVVFDEVHRLLEKYGGKGGYIALEKACREFRKWGIGVMMASQVNADFKEAVQGNILTEVQLNTKAVEDIKKMEKKYGKEYARRISSEGVGTAMVQHPKYNKGKPWFIQFRPTLHSPHKIPEEDLKKYDEYTTQLTKIEKQIENLKKNGKDVTDISLELKLAKDKLSQGHFKMAKIYLDSLNESLKHYK